MTLSEGDLAIYRHCGHLTAPGIIGDAAALNLIDDIQAWGESFLAELPQRQRAWYVDGGVKARTVLRKLDNPHQHRALVRDLARTPALVERVEAIIGRGVSLYFSQVFFKPPEGGGPKPAHQDNFYFGPNDEEGVVTAWVALDDATLENGCLYLGEGTNRGPVYAHEAPADEPFNLQLPAQLLARRAGGRSVKTRRPAPGCPANGWVPLQGRMTKSAAFPGRPATGRAAGPTPAMRGAVPAARPRQYLAPAPTGPAPP